MLNTKKAVFQIIRDTLDENSKKKANVFSERELMELFSLMNSFDLAHLIPIYVEKHKIKLENLDFISKLEKKKMEAIYRYQKFEYEREDLRSFFLEIKTPYILLKGTALRDIYPVPYIRTSADIDVLVKEEDYERCIEVFHENPNYTVGSRCVHHIEIVSKRDVHIELHRTLIAHDDTIAKPLSHLWEIALTNEYNSESFIPKEYFLYYLIAHMEKHFVHGGCGIRPFMDIYLYESKNTLDRGLLSALLKEGKLEKFYTAVKELILYWFEDGNESELTRKMEEYLFLGGTYGSLSNSVLVKRTGKGKFSYILSRIFLPYRDLIYQYPKLKGHKILTPLYEIKRWFRFLFKGNHKRTQNELKEVQKTTNSDIDKTKEFLSQLGIGESGLV